MRQITLSLTLIVFIHLIFGIAHGQTWKSQKSGTTERLESVYFIDDKIGWVVGGFGKSVILHTRDGGENWLAQNNPATLGLNSVRFVNAMEGWAVGGSCFRSRTTKGVILHTSNGGQTWELQKYPTHHMLTSVHFVDVTNGWAVGEDYFEANGGKGTSVILRTTNGGRSWVKQTVPPQAVGLNSVFFANVNEGWATGQLGTIIHTNNGGSSWIVQDSITKTWVFSIYFLDLNNGWAVTGPKGGEIIHTSDGGNTWSVQAHGYSDLRSIYFVDEKHGYAVGPRGMIVNTEDAGKTWHSQNIKGCKWLSSVFFTNPFLGWAVGAEGNIFKLQEPIEGQTEMYVLFDTTETGILSPSAPQKVSGIDEWPTKLTVTNNLDLWLEIVPGITKKGVLLKDVECLASKWQDKTFGKAGLRLLPPKGEIEFSVIYRKAKVPFYAEARFGDFAATLMITKVLATLPVPGIGRLDDPVIFLELWDKVRKIDSIQEAASALKSGKIADASKKLISLVGEEKQLELLRQAFAAFKIEVSKKAFINFLTIAKISKVLNILGDQITLAIQSKAGAKPIRASFELRTNEREIPKKDKKAITVWKVGSPYEGDLPQVDIPKDLQLEVQKMGYSLVIETFRAKGFADKFFNAVSRNVEPEILVTKNYGIIRGATTKLGKFVGVISNDNVRKSLVQVVEPIESLGDNSFQFLISTAFNYASAKSLAMREPKCESELAGNIGEFELSEIKGIEDLSTTFIYAFYDRDTPTLTRIAANDAFLNNIFWIYFPGAVVKIHSTKICALFGNKNLLFVPVRIRYEQKGRNKQEKGNTIIGHRLGHLSRLLILNKSGDSWKILSASRIPNLSDFFQISGLKALVSQLSNTVDKNITQPVVINPPDNARLTRFPRPYIEWTDSGKGVIGYLVESQYTMPKGWRGHSYWTHSGLHFVSPFKSTSKGKIRIQAPFGVGHQPHRWRVWAIDRSGEVSISAWRTIDYTN